MGAFLITLQQVVSSMPYFAVVFVLALFGKVFFDKTTPFVIGEELTAKDNPAFGVAFAGYVVGLGIALSGSLPPLKTGPPLGSMPLPRKRTPIWS